MQRSVGHRGWHTRQSRSPRGHKKKRSLPQHNTHTRGLEPAAGAVENACSAARACLAERAALFLGGGLCRLVRAFGVVAVWLEGAGGGTGGVQVFQVGSSGKGPLSDATHLSLALRVVERRGGSERGGVAEGDGDRHGAARDSNGRRFIRWRDPRDLLAKLDGEGGVAEPRACPPLVGRVQDPFAAVRICQEARKGARAAAWQHERTGQTNRWNQQVNWRWAKIAQYPEAGAGLGPTASRDPSLHIACPTFGSVAPAI